MAPKQQNYSTAFNPVKETESNQSYGSGSSEKIENITILLNSHFNNSLDLGPIPSYFLVGQLRQRGSTESKHGSVVHICESACVSVCPLKWLFTTTGSGRWFYQLLPRCWVYSTVKRTFHVHFITLNLSAGHLVSHSCLPSEHGANCRLLQHQSPACQRRLRRS